MHISYTKVSSQVILSLEGNNNAIHGNGLFEMNRLQALSSTIQYALFSFQKLPIIFQMKMLPLL